MNVSRRKWTSLVLVLALVGSMFTFAAVPPTVVKAVTDTQAPTAPGNPGSIWRTPTSAHLVWTASTDDTGVTGYDIYEGSTLIGSTPNGSPNYLVTGLAEGINHIFTVKAKDAAGNGSAPSSAYTFVYGALDRGAWSVSASLMTTDAKFAIDNLSSTRWTTGTAQNTGMWFQIDMGAAAKTYDKVVLDGSGDYIRKYSITVSDDNVNWSAPIATGTGTSSTVTATFAPQTARYLRITATAYNSNYWSIYDLNVFGTVQSDTTAPSAPSDVNATVVYDNEVQLGWTASSDASGVWGYDIYAGTAWVGFSASTSAKVTGLSPNTGYSFTVVAKDLAGNASAESQPVSVATKSALNRTLWSANASHSDASAKSGIDGSTSSRWSSGGAQAAGMWYQVDTGPGDKTYNKLVIESGGDYARAYEIRVSSDGTDWSAPIASGTGNNARLTVTFPEQTAKYVRIILTGSAGVYWSVYDLNIYGTAAPDNDPPARPTGLSAAGVLDTQLDLSWNASTDNIAVMGYNIYAGSTFLATTTATTYRLTGLSPAAAYSFSVEAKDLSGNVSAQSDALLVTTQNTIEVPLIAKYEMEPDANDAALLQDGSGLGQTGKIYAPASYADGRTGGGKALKLTGPDQAKVTNTSMLDRMNSKLTLTAWIKPDDLNTYQPIVTKRDANWKGTTFYLGLEGSKLRFAYDYGEKWNNWTFGSPAIQAGQWIHIAVAFEENAGVRFYVNGTLIGTINGAAAFPGPLPNDVDMLIGTEWHYDSALRAMIKYGFRGSIDSLRMYAAPLTYDQVQFDMNSTIATRQAQPEDFATPMKYATFRLERFDMPSGLYNSSTNNSKTHQLAVRVDGANAVDWPAITLTIPQPDQTVKTVQPFVSGAEFKTEIWLQQNPKNMPSLQQSYDNVINPGNHWVRGLYWRWGQTNMYTSDRTARTWTWDHSLWTFPVKISGSTSGSVKNVVLKSEGAEIYNSGIKQFDSLTLLLPQNEPGKPYELWVDGRGPVSFNAGLQEIEPGNPKDVPIHVDMEIPGSGPAITLKTVDTPETFPNQTKWNEDTAALSAAKPVTPSYTPVSSSIKSHVGVDVPRSPEGVNFIYLPHGMSSGGYFHSEHSGIAPSYQSIGSASDYAAYVSDTGYDRVFEFGNFGSDAAAANSHDRVAKELADRGVQFGYIPMTDLSYFDLRSQNLPFYTSYLSDFHQPLYRLLQLGLQRLSVYPNIAGVSLGADNAGYAQYWDWAPPHPNRPWARAYEPFQKLAGQSILTPLAPSLQGSYSPKTHEQFASTTKEFTDYIARYNETFKNYGYFAKATQAVKPGLAMTTGSFGSSGGVGARGGWNWATIPGKEMHEQIPVQSAYDWNELDSSKPLHQVALLDRLRSYNPVKTTWALQDDFSLFFGKMDREKTYAMTLTRGIQSIGTNVLPNDKGSKAQPQMIAEQKELYSWIHKYGGAYSMTEPAPSVGIMYVNEQALLRTAYAPETSYVPPTEEGLLHGSHEGKVTEALLMTHAAGWPSKVITPEELKRGLPSSIKTILLVGLNSYDDSWHWYDGMTNELQSFVDQGGLIVKDDESVSPVAAVASGMQVRAYIIQNNTDQTHVIMTRNADNIAKLKTVMANAVKPVAVSDSSTVWAVPTRAGDTQYVTVLNENHDTAAGNEQHLIGQTGTLVWNTQRPIYDVRLGRKVTQAEASQVDLTVNGFQWYALPPAEVTAPAVTVEKGDSGYYEAFASISNPAPMTGIPLELTVTNDVTGDTATVYSAAGLTARLPLKETDASGVYTVTVKELLSGLTSAVQVTHTSPAASGQPDVKLYREADLRAFADRSTQPLTVALTAAQYADSSVLEQANRLVTHYLQKGRSATLGLAEPGGVVHSLQDYKTYLSYPQWKTTESDLILFGNTASNVLLLDQARGYLLPEQGTNLAAGKAAVSYANSPFVGEYDVMNLIAGDLAGITAAVDAILSLPEAPPDAPRFLTVTHVGTTSIGLSWMGKAAGFTVERRRNGDSEWQSAGTTAPGQTAFTDSGLSPDTLYTYRVRAAGASGQTPPSDEARIITLRPDGDWLPPSAPGNPVSPSQSETTVDLIWSASIDDTGVTGYDVYNGLVKVNDTDITGTAYTVTGLSPGMSYSFTVRAKDAAGNVSAPSAAVSAATKPGALSRTGWTATASHNAYKAANALDGIPSTRWDTGVNQASGQYYQVDLQENRTFNKIVLDATNSSGDYPRGYAVYVSANGTDWSPAIASGAGSAVTSIVFPKQTARYVKITLTSGISRFWSIHELNIYNLDLEAPSAPANLASAGETDTTVTLNWSPSTDNIAVTGYDVYMGSTKVNGTDVTGVTYTVTGLSASTGYTFTVRAKDGAGNVSPDSNAVTVRTKDAPLSRAGWTAFASPNAAAAMKALDGNSATRWDTVTHQVYGQYYQVDLSAELTFNRIVLDTTGSPNDYPRGYQVYASTDGVYWGAPITSGAGATVTAIQFPAVTARYAKIVQTGSDPLYYWSIHELTIYQTDSEAPSAPANLTSSGQSETSVSLAWSPSSDNVGVAGYNVYNGGVKVNAVPIGGTGYTVTGLAASTSYSFNVTAVDAAGNLSAPSNVATVKTKDLALSRTGWTATASHNASNAINALDGNLSTRWDTVSNQVYGQYYQVDMQTQLTFNKIVLDASYSSGDYPRGYEVYVSSDGMEWGTPVASGSGSAVTAISLPAQTARFIRIVQTGWVARYWSIHEFYVYNLY